MGPQARRCRGWVRGALAFGLLTPAALAAEAADGARPGLPPVVELGVGSTSPAVPAREALTDLLQQLESLQAEMRNLRGQVEVQGNEIERLKARQRELLADIDRRVTELERHGTGTAPPGAVSAGTTATAPSPVSSAVSAREQQDYDAVFTLMKQGVYASATKGFRDFIAKYPESTLRDNAQYWLGEAYFVVRNFRQALEEFTKLMSNYPNSLKAPDALLKIGYCHYELGQWAKARESLNQVMVRYSGKPAAASAEQRLAKMKQEGH